MADTHAQRQARYRARQAASQEATLDVVLASLEAILAGQADLGRKVDNLAKTVDKRHVTRGADSADSATSRDAGGRPRARVGGEAPAPYGGLGASRSSDVTEDLAHLVSTVLAGRGANSVGAIVDHLTSEGHHVGAGQVAAVLVHLQGRGAARREPGEGPIPDRWTVDAPVPPPPLVPPIRVEAAPDVHVTCLDYVTHQAAHAWDPDLGAFRCALCTPIPAPVTTGGLTNGHA